MVPGQDRLARQHHVRGRLDRLLTGITYGIQPYGGHVMGWTSPLVLTGLIGGVTLLALFCVIELKVSQPMFDLHLLRIRAFAAGNAATLLASIARGGLQFMLILWLQGIWLVLHGYNYADTPLWSGIYLLPLTAGFLVAGPLSGWLSDRYGARFFASGGLLLSAASFGGLLLLPTNFSYPWFAILIFVSGAGMGLFSAPNAAAAAHCAGSAGSCAHRERIRVVGSRDLHVDNPSQGDPGRTGRGFRLACCIGGGFGNGSGPGCLPGAVNRCLAGHREAGRVSGRAARIRQRDTSGAGRAGDPAGRHRRGGGERRAGRRCGPGLARADGPDGSHQHENAEDCPCQASTADPAHRTPSPPESGTGFSPFDGCRGTTVPVFPVTALPSAACGSRKGTAPRTTS